MVDRATWWGWGLALALVADVAVLVVLVTRIEISAPPPPPLSPAQPEAPIVLIDCTDDDRTLVLERLARLLRAERFEPAGGPGGAELQAWRRDEQAKARRELAACGVTNTNDIDICLGFDARPAAYELERIRHRKRGGAYWQGRVQQLERLIAHCDTPR